MKRLWFLLAILMWSLPAWAQLDLVDPDAKGNTPAEEDDSDSPPVRKPTTPAPKPAAAPAPAAAPKPAPPVAAPPPIAKPGTAAPAASANKDVNKDAARDAGVAAGLLDAGVKDPKAVEAPKKEPASPFAEVIVSRITDSDLETAWKTWKKAAGNPAEVALEQKARATLLDLKKKLGARNIEVWAMGLLRAASTREDAGDSAAAVEMALSATQLAPDLPASWIGLGVEYFRADPADIGRYLTVFRTAIVTMTKDPRYLRPVIADAVTVIIGALLCTAIVFMLVLTIRRGQYFLYDFHFLFPKSVARWQSAAVALILLSLPVIFRAGIVPALLIVFLAISLYLTLAERIVAAALLAILGVVPVMAGSGVDATTFAGTRAEDIYMLERGGPVPPGVIESIEDKVKEDKGTFAELFSLAHYELRRGKLDLAAEHFKRALAVRPGHAGAKNNLAVALFLSGDLENPKDLLVQAVKDDPNLAVAYYNLTRVYQRRIATYGEQVLSEVDKAQSALFEAKRRDPTLDAKVDEARPLKDVVAMQYVRSTPLSEPELLAEATLPDAAKRVTSQLTQLILGDVPEAYAPFYPLVVGIALVALGFFSRLMEAARPCAKCGRAVSRRDDPELSTGSQLCTQCVNVFAKKNIVQPSLKVRKQLEVARYQSRTQRVSYGLGFLCAGMGHVFSGLPVRGVLYGFLFLLAVVGFIMRNGLLRAPYDPLPLVLRVGPLVVLFMFVYLLSLRGLRRRQG